MFDYLSITQFQNLHTQKTGAHHAQAQPDEAWYAIPLPCVHVRVSPAIGCEKIVSLGGIVCTRFIIAENDALRPEFMVMSGDTENFNLLCGSRFW